jgi:hypothetical protein
MRTVTLFVGAVVVFVLIGIDTWLCIRTLTPSALAGSRFNPLSVTTGAKGPPIPHFDNYLFVPG